MHKPILFLIGIPLVLVGCEDSVTNPPSGRIALPPPPNVSASRTRETPYTRLAALEQRIPGFAGHYLDPSGNMHVMLTDTGRIQLARMVLAPLHQSYRGYSSRPGGPPASTAPQIIAQPAKYAFSELLHWKQGAWRIGLGRGVVRSGIDIKSNQITIGVRSAADVGAVLELLAEAGIPQDAIMIRATGLAMRAVGDSLTTYQDTLEGGLQILPVVSATNQHVGFCTIGFNAWSGSNRVFVTNSHCTADKGGPNATTFYQPNTAEGRLMGFEYFDPEWKSVDQGGDCILLSEIAYYHWASYPENGNEFKCRESDAALIYYDPSVGVGEIFTNTIARTTFFWGPNESPLDPDRPGSTEIDQANPRFNITSAEYSDVPYGSIVQKVGRTTGWTYGEVVDLCEDFQLETISGNASEYVLLCQVIVHGLMRPGDSGAPVFILPGTSTSTDVILVGVMNHFWYNRTGYEAIDEYAYSRFSAIESELGPLAVY